MISLGEERANLSASRTFVRFALVWFCLFPLPFPLGVWEGLRLVIVALPGLFSYLFFIYPEMGAVITKDQNKISYIRHHKIQVSTDRFKSALYLDINSV